MEKLPEGAIPAEEFDQEEQEEIPAGSVPEGSFHEGIIPEEQFVSDQDRFGTPSQQAITAVEQGLSGLTLGASKVAETKLLGVPPENIHLREQENPITAKVSDIVGTGGLLIGTGGIGGLLPETAGLAARLGAAAVEGGIIGGANQATDDWSQDKPTDVQKIVTATGIGTLLGVGGGLLGEGIGKVGSFFKNRRLLKEAKTAQEQATAASAEGAAAPIVDAPGVKGVQASSLEDIANQIAKAKEQGIATELPSKTALSDAASRVELDFPINPAQVDSLTTQHARDAYRTAKVTPGETGELLTQLEAIQKAELTAKTVKTVEDLAPNFKVTPDAVKGGKHAIDAFTENYHAEKTALSPFFESLKKVEIPGNAGVGVIRSMLKEVPEIANMFTRDGNKIAFKGYNPGWGLTEGTYKAVKDIVTPLLKEQNPSLRYVWNLRGFVDKHVPTQLLTKSSRQQAMQVEKLQKGVMDFMQESSGIPEIRDAFKRYAINEERRKVVEQIFGASVGAFERGEISKIKPELISDKIFSNTANVEAAKNILTPDQFKQVLGNWLSENIAKVTKDGVFSSNKFGSFLNANRDALNAAFSDNLQALQRLTDLNTISRILPDAASVNPSGTAQTVIRMMADKFPSHGITYLDIVKAIPKQALKEYNAALETEALNNMLAGEAFKNAQKKTWQDHVVETTERMNSAIKSIFSSTASESRKANE